MKPTIVQVSVKEFATQRMRWWKRRLICTHYLRQLISKKLWAQLNRLRLFCLRSGHKQLALVAAKATLVSALLLSWTSTPVLADDPVFSTPMTNTFGITNVGLSAKPTFIDINGDGDFDAFIGRDSGDTLFFENTGTVTTPTFAAPITNTFGLTNVGGNAAPAFADINGDGDFDAFIGDKDGNTEFFENTGTVTTPTFAAPITNTFGITDVGERAAPTFVDIDGDNDVDTSIGNGTGDTLFFRNTGTVTTPTFAAPITNAFGLIDVGFGAAPTFVDIDGDFDVDAFIGNDDGNTLFFRNTGTVTTPTFAAPLTNTFGLTDVGLGAAPTFVDIDGDSDVDAFIGNDDGNTLFFRNGRPQLILTKTATLPMPKPGQTLTYTIVVANDGVGGQATNVSISDTLPSGLNFVGPVNLDPPQGGAGLAQNPSDLPALAISVTITAGERITLTFPVTVSETLSRGLTLTNTAAVTSAEITTPKTGSVAIVISGADIYLPIILKN